MTKKLSPEKAAAEWLSIKAAIKHSEKRLGELKEILEPALRDADEQQLELCGWRFSLTTFVKETFSLSKAKKKIDGRTLSPFITESEVTQIRTSFQGGEKEEEVAA